MTLNEAIELLRKEYEEANQTEWVHDPLAYAVYQVGEEIYRKKIKNLKFIFEGEENGKKKLAWRMDCNDELYGDSISFLDDKNEISINEDFVEVMSALLRMAVNCIRAIENGVG